MDATLRLARLAARTLAVALVLGAIVGNINLILLGLTGCVLAKALNA